MTMDFPDDDTRDRSRDRRDPGSIRVIAATERRLPEGPATPGMERQEALAEDGVWLGTVATEPGILTGWHHHGDYDTYIYVIRGDSRVDTWDGTAVERQQAGDGAFVVIPRGVVHREGSASTGGVEAVLVRIGEGQVVFPADGPDED